jgi:hypothetical protein
VTHAHLRSGLLALGLIAATPASLMAQSAPRILASGCSLVAAPAPENVCQTPDRLSALDSVTGVVESNGRSEIIDSSVVAATFGLNGPTIIRSDSGQGGDVEATGSVTAPSAKR